MSGIEQLIKMVYRLYRKRHNQANSPCPDEETLVCFLEGRSPKDESKRIQEHLISCQLCAERASIFHRGLKQEREVPEFLIKKAKDLVAQDPFPDILEIILALKEKAMQILGATGDVILDNEIIPMPVLRSRQISEFPEEIKLIKEFEDIKITIHIQRRDKDKIRMNLDLVDRTNLKPMEDLRLTLLKGTQELESYSVTSGTAVFDKVGFGRYAIQILHKNLKLGVINLEIK